MADTVAIRCAYYNSHFMSREEFARMTEIEARMLHLRFRFYHGGRDNHLHDLSGLLCGLDCEQALMDNTPFIAMWAVQDRPGVYEDAPICKDCMRVFVSGRVQS